MELNVISNGGTRRIEARAGENLLEALRRAELAITAPCGGKGSCGKCRVQLCTPLGRETVLACQTPAQEGMTVELSTEGKLAVETGGKCRLLPPDPGQQGYGVACDIGTTTVVCHLIDLTTGGRLATVSGGNTQRMYGADVIARITASMEGKREEMTRCIRSQLNSFIHSLCAQTGIGEGQVSRMVVAGNTVMCHLFAGLSPDSIGVAPFTPESLFGEWVSAEELELCFPGRVLISPAVAGYVGGDITADMLAAQLWREEKPVLLIDIGTNGEMVLGCGDRYVACATAAGPAFEGAQIKQGMTAAPGAVSRVDWEEDHPALTVLGGGAPQGICGSGLVDALAMLLDLGVVDETGCMLDEDEVDGPAADWIDEDDDGACFWLDEEHTLAVTQGDVRKLQLAKGAIAAGIQILTRHYGIPVTEVSALLLAGGFGSYIRPESAARIGLIPKELLPVTRAVGNAAGEGAVSALISEEGRQQLEQLCQNCQYIELSQEKGFSEAYMEAMMFEEAE